MKKARAFQYFLRRFFLGTDPESVLFIVVLVLAFGGLALPDNNPILVVGCFLLLMYSVAILIWLRAKFS